MQVWLPPVPNRLETAILAWTWRTRCFVTSAMHLWNCRTRAVKPVVMFARVPPWNCPRTITFESLPTKPVLYNNIIISQEDQPRPRTQFMSSSLGSYHCSVSFFAHDHTALWHIIWHYDNIIIIYNIISYIILYIILYHSTTLET